MRGKRFFLTGLSMLALIVVLAFAACSQPTEFSDTSRVGLNELDAPTGIVATAYGSTGVIYVAWDPVANADSYRLFRKTVSANGAVSVTELTAGIADTSYVDQISYANQFESGAAYTYRVVAESKYSTTGTAPNTGNDLIGDSFDGVFFMQNSFAESEAVSFDNLRAQGDKLATPTGITVKEGFTYATVAPYGKTQVIQVSWKAEPYVNYILSYGYAGEANANTPRTFAMYLQAQAGQNSIAYDLPLIFGEGLVEVIATTQVRGDSAKDVNGVANPASKYYMDSDPAIVTHKFADTILATPTNLGVTRNGNFDELEWDDMPDAESYKVFRAKYRTISGGTAVYQQWTDITGEVTFFGVGEGGTVYANAARADNYDEYQSTYEYLVYSVNGDAVSLPDVETVTDPWTMPALTVAFDGNLSSGWDIQADDWKAVDISWMPANRTESYKLSRAAVELDEGSTNVWIPADGAADFDWVEIDNLTANELDQNYEDGQTYSVNDKPAYRKSYRYRLQAFAGTTLKGTSYGNNLVSTGPYNNDYDDILIVNAGNIKVYDIDYSFNIPSDRAMLALEKFMLPGEVLTISKAPLDAQGKIGAYEFVEDYTITEIKAKYGLSTTVNYGPGSWVFKAEIVGMDGDQYITPISGANPSFTASNITADDSVANGVQFVVPINLYPVGAGAKLIVRYATGADAVSRVNSDIPGDYTEVELTMTVDTLNNQYETSTVPIIGTNCAAKVFLIRAAYSAINGSLDADINNAPSVVITGGPWN